MAYVTNKKCSSAELGRNYGFKVGDVARTKRVVDCFFGVF